MANTYFDGLDPAFARGYKRAVVVAIDIVKNLEIRAGGDEFDAAMKAGIEAAAGELERHQKTIETY